jgi:hypothetical protein
VSVVRHEDLDSLERAHEGAVKLDEVVQPNTP